MAFKRRLKFDKRIKFKKKMSIMYILLFVVMLSLGTGYAYIKSDLNINGTAKVKNARFDVHFDNLRVDYNSVPTTTPTIVDATTIEFTATLENPGDIYEFKVDVVNNGTMDAMIDSFSISPTLTTAQQKYLVYEITYFDGAPLESKQELKAGTTETLIVNFYYKEYINTSDYPTEDQSFNVSFSANYVQATNEAIAVKSYFYLHGHESIGGGIAIGEDVSGYCIINNNYFGNIHGCYDTIAECESEIPENVSPEEIEYCSCKRVNQLLYWVENPILTLEELTNSSEKSFIKYTFVDEQVVKNELGFVYEGNIYYLPGGEIINNSIVKGDYMSNKAILQDIFGSNNCMEINDGTTQYKCSSSGLNIGVFQNGDVYSSEGLYYGCSITGANALANCEREIG